MDLYAKLEGDEECQISIFDKSGKLAASETASREYYSKCLQPGEYRFVFMKRSPLFYTVSEIGKLKELGFEKGKDYLERSCEIEDGRVIDAGILEISSLRNERLQYTLEDETYLTCNSRKITVGTMVYVKLAFQIAPAYSVSEQIVSLELPEGISVAGNSVTWNGEQIPYTSLGHTVTVPVRGKWGDYKALCVGSGVREKEITAYLSFLNRETQIKQPLGTETLNVLPMEFSAPSYTVDGKVAVSGITVPLSEVAIYENGTVRGLRHPIIVVIFPAMWSCRQSILCMQE